MPRKYFINSCENKYKVRNVAQDTYYFLIIFLILALLLAGELSTLTRSFNNLTIIPITLFTLLLSNLGFSLTADFVRLIWYSLPLVEYIPSGVYMIKCHSVPVVVPVGQRVFSSFHPARFCHSFTRCESEIRTKLSLFKFTFSIWESNSGLKHIFFYKWDK